MGVEVTLPGQAVTIAIDQQTVVSVATALAGFICGLFLRFSGLNFGPVDASHKIVAGLLLVAFLAQAVALFAVFPPLLAAIWLLAVVVCWTWGITTGGSIRGVNPGSETLGRWGV
jgi:hypothetical protein